MGPAELFVLTLLAALALDALVIVLWRRVRRTRRVHLATLPPVRQQTPDPANAVLPATEETRMAEPENGTEPLPERPTAFSTSPPGARLEPPADPGERRPASPESGAPRLPSEPGADTVASPAGPGNSGPHPELALLLLGGALLVLLGQVALPLLDPTRRWPAYVVTVLGLAGFALAVRGFITGGLPRWAMRILSACGRWLGVNPMQALLLGSAPVLSLAAWLAAGDRMMMLIPWAAVILWLLAILLIVLGSRQRGAGQEPERWPWPEVAAVAGIVLLAFLARAVWLQHVPWVFTGDEGSAGMSAVDFAQGTQDNIFDVGWFSFPSLYFFIESLSVRLLGQTMAAARLPSAIAGSLAVLALYWYARSAFGRGVALAAAAYLATFPIHIHFSRTGLNNIWDSLTAVAVAGGVWRGWVDNRRSAFVLAGLALGLGQYFYPSARVLFIILLIWLLFAALKDRAKMRQRLPGLVTMLLTTLVVVLPLGLYYVRHMDQFYAPMVRVSVIGPWLQREVEITQTSLWQVLWRQVKTSALAFSSLNLRGHFNDAPMLLALPSALFLLGVCLTFLSVTSLQHLWLVLWLAAAIGIGALSESTPTSQRYLFSAPAVAILVTLPLVQSAQWLSKLWPRWRRLLSVAMALVLVIAMAKDVAFYFGEYSANRRFGDLNTETATGVAFYVNSQGPGQQVYFFGPPRMGYFTHETIRFLAPEATGQDVNDPLAAPPDWQLVGPTIFIFLPERQQELQFVEQSYPGGSVTVVDARDGNPLFIAYKVEGPQSAPPPTG
jgi:4-amino-4-deoxy-L-arabinose transferase-like glycosyltransferase